MSFLDRVGNKVDNLKSKQSENSDIKDLEKRISDEKDAIDIAITKIGEFYWNQYAKGAIDAPEEIKDIFAQITVSVNTVGQLEEDIKKRKADGIQQREENDQATKEKEEMKAAEAQRRKEERKEAKRIASEEKAAKESIEDDEL